MDFEELLPFLPMLYDVFFDDEVEQITNQVMLLLLERYMKRRRRKRVCIKNYAEEVVPMYSDRDFKSHFRLNKSTFEVLLGQISAHDKEVRAGRPSVITEKQLLSAIWLLANQESYRSLNTRSRFIQGFAGFNFLKSCKFSTKIMPGTSANVLSGREVSKAIQQELQLEVESLKADHPQLDPVLAIVQVGAREDSNVYIRMKKKVAAEVGVRTKHIQLPRTLTEAEIYDEVQKLNEDPSIHGIIVQLPLDTDTPVDNTRITNAVSPSKDVDGIHDVNAGRLSHGELEGHFIACTPFGCLELIKRTGVTIKGSRAVVIGRSKIVGMPMAMLLLWQHATVTICHSRTKDLQNVVKEADIVVAAVGQARMVKKDWVKRGAVVIDCGINSIKDETRASGTRLVGDVDYDEVKDVASWITPVPGGVGPMTVIMLVKNTVLAAKKALLKA